MLALLLKYAQHAMHKHNSATILQIIKIMPLMLVVFMSAATHIKLECGPMPSVMVALPNIGGTLCSTPQSLVDAQYYSAVQ